jgi:hypothetical protein
MDTNEENKIQEVELSPMLKGLRKKNPYQVPDAYFSKFENEVMMKISTPSYGKRISSQTYFKVAMSIAATIVICFSVYHFVMPKTANGMTAMELKSALKTLPEAELNQYLMQNANGLNEDILAQTLDFDKNIYKMELNSADSTIVEAYINEVDDAYILEQN